MFIELCLCLCECVCIPLTSLMIAWLCGVDWCSKCTPLDGRVCAASILPHSVCVCVLFFLVETQVEGLETEKEKE